MSHCVVRLNGTEEVEEFVKAASKCDFDIDIFYNRVIIDAKSILGILSMDLNRDLTYTAMVTVRHSIKPCRNLL